MGPGVDDVDSYQELCRFVRTVAERSGVRHFIIHARKCMLNGLSPHQNRTIPPLRSAEPVLGRLSPRGLAHCCCCLLILYVWCTASHSHADVHGTLACCAARLVDTMGRT